MLIGLPDLHSDAIGATVQGVYYTREEYEALRARTSHEHEMLADLMKNALERGFDVPRLIVAEIRKRSK
jgi:hypothetical protein